MSKKTDAFEQEIAEFIQKQKYLPSILPQWMLELGIRPHAKIIQATRTGSKNSKTDIYIALENSTPLKISAKLANADYFGNWYSHTRVINEFGEHAFQKLVTDCTEWANKWRYGKNASLFVGVSICFGKRSGDTAREFTDIFTVEDIVKIVAGVGEGDSIANCLYQGNDVPQTIEQFLTYLKPINEETIKLLSENFKIAYRPINPKTEHSNRGKCSYTQFRPYEKLIHNKEVNSLEKLNELGKFEEVTYNSINHNRIIKELETDYNITIPKKMK